MSCDQHLHILGRDRHEFRSDDASIGDTCGYRLEAIEVAAKICEMDLGRSNLVLLEDRIDKQIGQRSRRCYCNSLALEVLHFVDGGFHHQAVRHAGPVAAENLDVGSACARENCRSRT